jgi:uncharacterized protein
MANNINVFQRFLFYPFIMLNLFLCDQLVAQDTNEINFTDSAGLKQGYWKKNDNYGRMIYEGKFVNDIPTGTFKYYYDNGRIKAVSEISENGRNSYTTLFHPHGQIMSEGKYVDRRRDSVWLVYDAHGQLIAREIYSNDLLHGKIVTFYQNGDTAEIAFYVNGLKHGSRRQFYRGGLLKNDGFFKNDTLHDTITHYYRSGQVRTQGQFNMEKPTGKWRYYLEDGKPEKTEFYDDGILVGRETYIDMEFEENRQ